MNSVKTGQSTARYLSLASAAFATAVLAFGILTSCVKREDELNAAGQIALSAEIVTNSTNSTHSAQFSSQTKAPVANADALELYFARADETASGTYGTYSSTPLTATRAAGTGAQSLTFDPLQYYRTSGLKTKLTGWHPQGTYDGTTNTVSWTINGQQDIMTAPIQEGSMASAMQSATFDHRLSQLRFHPYAEAQSAIDSWGKITRIDVLNQQNTATYALSDDATGAVSFSGAATNTFSAGVPDAGVAISLSTMANKTTDAKQIGNAVMIAPQSSSEYTLALRVYTDKNIMKTITLKQSLQAGVPYRLYLRFGELDITIEAAVAQWDDVATSDNIGNVRIGDYLNGGVVFCIDDEHHYKVVSVENIAILNWSTNSSYVIGAPAQDNTDGKANTLAIKNYFDNNKGGSVTELSFDSAFPAAAYCYNYQGKNNADAKGTWYLPAKHDLQFLWCAMNGQPPVSWESGIPTDIVTIDPNAQDTFRECMIKAGGSDAAIPRNLWSSTESNASTDKSWSVKYNSDALTSLVPKSTAKLDVRCVKNITPQPAVGDYYFTDGSFSSKLESGKIVNGIVYWVDVANYKVVSLDEMQKMWAVSSTFVVNAAQSDADGKANSKAIRDYFEANEAIVGDDFNVVFPAASYCYNYTGKDGTDTKGTWYLPAKNELQHLWCAYNGKDPINWTTDTNDSAAADDTAQAVFKRYLTTAGGVDISNNPFWSSTENSGITSYAWYVYFSVGYTNGSDKDSDYYVRCVRDI